MKKLFFILIAASLFSCKKEEKKESIYPEGTNTEQVTEGTTPEAKAPEQLGPGNF